MSSSSWFDSLKRPKLDQNRNPLNDHIVDENNDGDQMNKNSKQRMSNKSLSLSNKFNESIHSLNLWIWQCQTWMYFYGACQACLQQQHQQNHSGPNNAQDRPRRMNQSPGIILKIPTIHKRILASIIDYSLIHFFYDQFRALLAEVWDYDVPFTSMDFKELESFFPEDDDGLEDLLPKIFWIYVKTIQYATLFYLFYLMYETMFLYGWPNRTYPGATIGKRILGLRVVSCNYLEQISLVDNCVVRVAPAGNITLVKAFLRTLVKLLPVTNTIQSINILSSRYNRSYFDARMGCLVVDMSAPAIEAAAAAAAAAAATAGSGSRNNNNNANQNMNNQANLQQQNRVFWW